MTVLFLISEVIARLMDKRNGRSSFDAGLDDDRRPRSAGRPAFRARTSGNRPALVEPVDPFDLPDWLGTAAVTWTATSSVRRAKRIGGMLSARGEAAAVRPAGR